MSAVKRSSERRSEHLLNDLLEIQGWDKKRPPSGDILFQSEYRAYPELAMKLNGASKTGKGFGIPEALIVDKSSLFPLAVIEAKADSSEINAAIKEATHYADALKSDDCFPLAIGLAGNEIDFVLEVYKWDGKDWVPVTYDGEVIGWIPNRKDITLISAPGQPSELRPTVPAPEVLAGRADEINRLLRESNIKDEFRPAVVAAIMLALWQAGKTGTQIRRDKISILKDINSACKDVFISAGKASLANSIRVDQANQKLAENARRIATILERLNVSVLTAEHDYLGQLYETFFRYTGGNTIGQYFTPRHIATLMAELADIGVEDTVIDPACGSGGFLVAAMERILTQHKLKREKVVDLVAKQLIGFESEPVTAALSVANMILRGDGSTGIFQADAFTSADFPNEKASVGLMNPPFPHKKTDTPAESFIDRALEALKIKGRLVVLIPTSILVKKNKGIWRERVLKNNRLIAVCQLPDELFQPFASATTSILILEKGIAHTPKNKVVFVRLNHDGLVLKKNTRVEKASEPDETLAAIDSILNKLTNPGFSGTASISGKEEWAVGAYIPSPPHSSEKLGSTVDELIRRLASFYTRYAPEVLEQRTSVKNGAIEIIDYMSTVSAQKLADAKAVSGAENEIAGRYNILYGLAEIESRDGMIKGNTLIVSPTESYNGCYGWLDFPTVLKPPFITVARTGSIGEAFVHFEPCAPNSDCLILLPKKPEWADPAELFLAASAIRLEKWRYNYGRKITPARISNVKLDFEQSLKENINDHWKKYENVIKASLKPYRS